MTQNNILKLWVLFVVNKQCVKWLVRVKINLWLKSSPTPSSQLKTIEKLISYRNVS